jgi:hypothetical protein
MKAVSDCFNRELSPSETEQIILCPVCKSDYVHMEYVVCNQGDYEVGVNGDGIHTRSNQEHARGSVVYLACWCENGHRFAFRFQFHKGQTFAELKRGVDFHPGTDSVSELWRD